MEKQPPLRVLAYLRETPWAILPSYLDTMFEVVEARMAGIHWTAEEKAARIEAARRSPAPATAPGSVAVIPIMGPLSQRMDMFSEISGGSSYEGIADVFRQAVADPNIGSIVLNVDSPGGSVYGLAELADTIWSARGSKPISTVANSMAASAAYWIGTQTDEFVVTPSGQVGSIGVIAYHDDISKAAEAQGVRRTYVTAGKYKAEGNPFEPLSQDARSHMQSQIDDYHDQFVRAVSRGRNVSLTKVREDFGEGRMFTAKRAVGLGLADRVGTLQEVIDKLASRQSKAAGARAEDEVLGVEAVVEEEAPLAAVEDVEDPAARDRARSRLQLVSAGRRA